MRSMRFIEVIGARLMDARNWGRDWLKMNWIGKYTVYGRYWVGGKVVDVGVYRRRRGKIK